MIFNPSQADVRRFFCSVRAKMKSESPMEAIETLASLWIAEHPEYFAELDDVDAAVARNYDAEPGRTNPFLHLSMHLSISEQCSVDSPRGIRQAVELLARKRDLHDAHHEVMECLGTMLWESQRSGRPPDGNTLLNTPRQRLPRRTPGAAAAFFMPSMRRARQDKARTRRAVGLGATWL